MVNENIMASTYFYMQGANYNGKLHAYHNFMKKLWLFGTTHTYSHLFVTKAVWEFSIASTKFFK